jgi:hypothetical protein
VCDTKLISYCATYYFLKQRLAASIFNFGSCFGGFSP